MLTMFCKGTQLCWPCFVKGTRCVNPCFVKGTRCVDPCFVKGTRCVDPCTNNVETGRPPCGVEAICERVRQTWRFNNFFISLSMKYLFFAIILHLSFFLNLREIFLRSWLVSLFFLRVVGLKEFLITYFLFAKICIFILHLW